MTENAPHSDKIAAPPDNLARGSLVPVKAAPDEDRQKPVRQFLPVKQYLNNIADHAVSIGNNSASRERRRKIAKMRMMYEGDQIIRWDDERQIYVNKKKAGDALYIDPVLATFIDIITAQVAKSRSTLKVLPRAEEKIQKQQAAKYAGEVLSDANKQLVNARSTQREIKYGFLLSGEAYRYTFFDKSVAGRGVERPKFGVKVTRQTPEAWYCPGCSASGLTGELKSKDAPDADPTEEGANLPDEQSTTAKAAARCPECDFPRVSKIGGRTFNATVSSGTEWENVGDANCEFIDPLEMTVVGAGDHIADALVVLRDRLIPRCVLESIYPDKVLPSTSTPNNLRYQQAAGEGEGGGGSDNQTFGGGEAFEMLHFQEVWLNHAVYDGYESPQPETLENGQKLDKGEKLLDNASSGLYYARVGKTLVDIYELAVRDCLTHAVNSVTSSFHGAGEWDLMPQQEQKNEIRSMQINGIMLDSFRPLMARSGAIDATKIPNKAGAIIKVNNLGEDKPLSYALDRVPGGGSIPDAYMLDDKLAGGMQQRSGAFSSTTDLPDAKLLGTATGVATLAEHAVGRRAPMLALRAEMEKEQAYQILELRQKYWRASMYDALDRKVGGDAGRWFRESNIRRDFLVEVVPESFMPQTDAQMAANFDHLMSMMPILAGSDPSILKKMTTRALELFGRGFELDSYQTEKVEAAIRLERVRQIADFFERESGLPVIDNEGNPVEDFINTVLQETAKHTKTVRVQSATQKLTGGTSEQLFHMPLDVLLDNHGEFIEQYAEWLKSSEGREASLFVRACVRTLIQRHKEAILEDTIEQKTEANLAQIPDQQAQMVANQTAHEQQLSNQLEAGDAQANQALEQGLQANDARVAQSIDHHETIKQLAAPPTLERQALTVHDA